MPQLDDHSIASLILDLEWESEGVHHRDRRYAARANLWRDILPPKLDMSLMGAAPGQSRQAAYPAGTLTARHDERQIVEVPRTAWDDTLIPRRRVEPEAGRHYPAAMIWKAGRAGIYPQTRTPMRCMAANRDAIRVDLNHPLAPFPLSVTVTVEDVLQSGGADNGGRATDWTMELTEGVGLAARRADGSGDLLAPANLGRIDASDDAQFYREPRLVGHLDTTASREVSRIYAEVLLSGMHVLDLMSSLQSHLPEVSLGGVTGLGMNAAELEANPRLTARIVHDLNREPRLPFADASFDAALCTVSIEYLTDPVRVVRDIARTLKPGAPFAVTWSNRWFPGKAVDIWSDLHPFERVGYVLEILARSGAFEHLETRSVQGYPRPAGDRYAATEALSDPVFAVIGRRK